MVMQKGVADIRTARVVVRFRTTNRDWKRAPAAYSGNGRVRPGYALIQGKPQPVVEHRYQVRYFEGRQPRYESAKNASEAAALRDRIEKRTTAKALARDAGLKVEPEQTRSTLAKTAEQYIQDAQNRKAMEAALQARNVAGEFSRVVKKTYVDEINKEDIYRFHSALAKRGCADRTIANKHARLKSWLLFAGASREIFPPKPRYEEGLPTIYESDQISTLLGEADSYMRLAIQIALKCGLRDQELMHLEFSDISWNERILRVRGKPKWGFHVKVYEQRDVPILDDVLEELRERSRNNRSKGLILGTAEGYPNTKLLRGLKVLARRAKLNCGSCDGCRAKQRECREFTLHKFRRTYITNLLRNDVDLRTVQAYAGHKDIKSTMRYVRPAGAKDVQAKLNAIKW